MRWERGCRMCGRVCKGCEGCMGEYKCIIEYGWVDGWGGCVGWGLEGHEWIGRTEEEELHKYIMIFVTFKENSSLVHKIIVPIKINTNIASVQNKNEGSLYNRYYFTSPHLTLQLQLGLIRKEREEGANHTQLQARFET